VKLFMVRLENGDATILQAVDELQARYDATGNEEELAVAIAQVKAEHPAWEEVDIRAEFMRMGLGPQRVTVRELNHFACQLTLADRGDIELHLESEDALDEVFLDYPILSAAIDANANDFFLREDRGVPTPLELDRLADAIQTERTRLTFEERL
jgi:hypothetical protein